VTDTRTKELGDLERTILEDNIYRYTWTTIINACTAEFQLRSYRSCNFKVIQHNIQKRNRSTSLDAVLLGTLRGTLRLAEQCVSQACSLLYIVCLHGAFGSWKEYGTQKKNSFHSWSWTPSYFSPLISYG
jgi:hypothetical protein